MRAEEIAYRLAKYTKDMTPEDKARCLDLFKQFIMNYGNSAFFKKKCDRLWASGLSPLEEWFQQHNF